MQPSPAARVVAVARDDAHRFSKPVRTSITLLAGLGVEGDAHLGTTVQHLSRKRRDPDAPNLRQVHLVHAELHDELVEKGYRVGPGTSARTSRPRASRSSTSPPARASTSARTPWSS